MEPRKVAYGDLDYTPFAKGFFFNPSGGIHFGPGVSKLVGEHVRSLGGNKAMVFSDPGVRKAGLLDRITRSLDEAGVRHIVFDEIEPNPSANTVRKATAAAKDFDPDVLVGLGGGSSIDVCKAAAIMFTNPGRIEDYEGINKVKVPPLPMIAIPTTAGTGAEATPFAVITDTTKGWKFAVGTPYNIPALALCDPELTLTLPPSLTAGTGMDALTHAIEGYTSTANQPISEALSLQAIRLIGSNLRKAVAQGHNLEARSNMLLGSTMAAMGFTNTILGICHSMAHPLGGLFDVPHGMANAIMLPIVMEFNCPAVPEKFRAIAEALGESTEGLSLVDAGMKAVESVRRLSRDIGIPSLRSFGISEKDVPKLAEEAMKGGDRSVNPRTTVLSDFVALYKKALSAE